MQSTKRAICLLKLFVLLAAAGLVAGCEPPPPSSQELGRIIFNELEVPGTEEPYTLPARLRNLKIDEKTDAQRPPGE